MAILLPSHWPSSLVAPPTGTPGHHRPLSSFTHTRHQPATAPSLSVIAGTSPNMSLLPANNHHPKAPPSHHTAPSWLLDRRWLESAAQPYHLHHQKLAKSLDCSPLPSLPCPSLPDAPTPLLLPDTTGCSPHRPPAPLFALTHDQFAMAVQPQTNHHQPMLQSHFPLLFACIPHRPATALLSMLPSDRRPSSILTIYMPSTPPLVQDAARLLAAHCSSSLLVVVDPKPFPHCRVAEPPSSTFQDPTTSFDMPRTPLPSSSLLPSFAMVGTLSVPSLSSLLFSSSPSMLLSPMCNPSPMRNPMVEHGPIQQ